ncbi:MAG: hypothetical protein ACREN7_02065 [Candidatus Dormibacteria bacterium]
MTVGGRRLLLLGALTAMGTLASLSISTSLALFSATGTQQVNTFTAGTVTLESCMSNASPTSGSACIPTDDTSAGDSSACTPTGTDRICYYTLEYTGSEAAWIGVYVDKGSCGCRVKLTATMQQGGGVPPYVISPRATLRTTPTPVGGTATPDELGEAVGSSPPATTYTSYQIKIKLLASDTSGSVTLTGTAVQAGNNTNTSGNGPVSWT